MRRATERAARTRPAGRPAPALADGVRRTPPWVASLLVHMVLVALIGPALLARSPRAPAVDGMVIDLELVDETPPTSGAVAAAIEQPPRPLATPKRTPSRGRPGLGLGGGALRAAPRAVDPAQRLLGALQTVEAMQSRRIAVFGQRTPEGRRRGIAAHGGSGATESAVERGLAWLATHQDPAGSWDSDEFVARCPPGDTCQRPGEPRGFAGYDVAQTGLALLAFLGAGYGPDTGGRHAGVARLAIGFLRRSQRADGAFASAPGFRAKFFYGHAIATLALAEAYGMTRDASLRDPVRRAVRLLVRSQNPRGGWDYIPAVAGRPQRNDSSVTGWVVMALEAARLAGVHVEQRALVGAIGHLRRMTRVDGRLGYVDLRNDESADLGAMTAVGLVCRLLLGQPRQAPEVQQAVARLAPPDASRWRERGQCLYYWYYGSLGAFLIGGQPWADWNRALKPALLETQLDAGHGGGSWPADSLWARQGGGRVYATALAVLTFEVYYKYVPRLLLGTSRPLAGEWRRPPEVAGPTGRRVREPTRDGAPRRETKRRRPQAAARPTAARRHHRTKQRIGRASVAPRDSLYSGHPSARGTGRAAND